MRTPGQVSSLTCSLVFAAVILAGSSLAAQQPATPLPDQPATPSPASEPATQQPAPAPQPAPQEVQQAPQPASPAASSSSYFTLPAAEQAADAPSISEDELRRQLEGKTFYLRSGHLDNALHFDAKGALNGSSPQASHTLSLVEIDHVRMDKHHLELEGVRYGLHFLGALPTEDQTQAVDKVRLTSKKKPLKITIDREQVVKPKKDKPGKPEKKKPASAAASPSNAAATQPAAVPPATQSAAATPAAQTAASPADDRHDAVTTSQGHANRTLVEALDRIFASGMDERMIATLPDYWKLFYKSVAERQDYRPSDPSVLRQSQVEQKARLLSAFEPPSNEYAQTNGVAGMAMYHVVVGADGKPQEIAVGRPIGFGLDENAVAAIRKASFQSATKGGQPVPVVLDLVVQFRIFSRRTAVTANTPAATPAATPAPANSPSLPGPYTANQPTPSGQSQ